MLQSLHIENYALIDKLEIEFSRGFSVITGETGSGKSIILGALSLLLGERADSKALRDEERKCVIEGVFDITNYGLESFFSENDLDYENISIIRREILPNGKSRAFLNDTPVNLVNLKEIGERLIDIHSQHKNLLLSNKNFQFNIIDTVAESKNLLNDYRNAYKELRETEKSIAELKQFIAQENANKDYLQFQYNQLKEANLQNESEQEELEAEQDTLNHAEDIKSALSKCEILLSSDENGIVAMLKDARRSLGNIADIFPKAKDIAERLNSCCIETDDIANDLQNLNNNLEYNQNRLDTVTMRLSTIYDLEQKHKTNSVAELKALRDEMGEKLQSIDNSDEQMAQLNKQKNELEEKANNLANMLTKQRQEAIPDIERTISQNLIALGIPNAQFHISLLPCELSLTGKDTLEFLFSANKNMQPMEISKIASGGEIARVMLCIKALISAQSGIATIIFDEIDTGVSGEIANKMGTIMQAMGKDMQVISITHLPQIAAKGTAHYKVSKFDTEQATQTKIERLNDKERINEIAQMLSGNPPSEAAIGNAKELLKM
ncbi:MAG: DNA repair protein RecN [Paludibacteraceae bacterium]|nr:DNA repair protein RecN [Paludibacteraceae bacterium]